jgi:polyphenol oxidase
MDFVTENNIKWLSMLNSAEIIAGFSTRVGGYSKGSYEGLNIGLNTDDDASIIAKNKALLFKTIAPSMVDFYLNQTHSNIVHDVDNDSFKVFCNGDGLLTTQKNILLCITIADCGSILFHDDKNSIACAIHCGWKGTQLGIIQNALNMLSEYTDLENIHAYVGPMIRCSSYEVGKEFLTYFGSEYFKESNGKLFFDLNQVIISKLLRANLASVTDCGFDTYSEPELFYSHRRNQESGRMCAFIGLK